MFEQAGALPRLEAFASEFGPRFYGLPLNDARVMLRRESWTVPEEYPFGADRLVPLHAGQTLGWRFAGKAR